MVRKTFCDRCGFEIVSGEVSTKITVLRVSNLGRTEERRKDYCESCNTVIVPFLDKKKEG